MPVLVSPVGTIAGAAAVPVPVVIRVVATRVGIVPVVLLNVAMVPVVLFRARLEVGTASATNAFSLAAVTSLVTPSVNEVPAVKLGIV
jgi:hypothetical protein